MESPGKQNPPDEEIAREAMFEINTVSGIWGGGSANSRTFAQTKTTEIILAALRKSKVGQVEEERTTRDYQVGQRLNHQGSEVEVTSNDEKGWSFIMYRGSLRMGSGYSPHKDLGKPEAVADHADSPPQNTILPCPFCGNTELFVSDSMISCRRCDSWAPPVNWNQRATPSVVAGVGEHAAGVSSKPARDFCRWMQTRGAALWDAPIEQAVREFLTQSPGSTSPQVEQVSAVQGEKALGEKEADVNAGDAFKAATKPNS